MIDAQTYLEHVRRGGSRIIEVAAGNLGSPVPTCPGNTVESLLMHVSSVLVFWITALETNDVPSPDWSRLHGDQVAVYQREFRTFVDVLSSRGPDEETWVWGRDPHVRFWYRRAAQELSIHRWDFENAVGTAVAIDPTLAADGVDELLEEFGPKSDLSDRFDVKSAAERFDGNGERLRFEATDLPATWTITAQPERFDVEREGKGDVVARGTASDLNLFVWGRVGLDALEVSGDASLLERWQERVKI